MSVLQLEKVEERARALLRLEPGAGQESLLRWAIGEMAKVGLDVHLSSLEADQGCHDLFGGNLALPDWLRARSVDLDVVRSAETFRELVDRLLPAFGDR